MAEFKLGRIRFVWQGDWTTGTAYVADDVVSFGGKSYICIVNHTASAGFQTDFTNAIPKWDIVSDGTSWKGDWGPEVEYAPGDVVKYGSIVYIAETGHTSATFASPDFLGLEEDLSKWTQFATSFDWKGDWTVATRFKINDLVKYGGYVYLCNTAHISAATVALGLEPDQAKWTLFSDGLVYLGDWVTGTRYKVNDVVKYGGNVFIATSAHTSSDFISDEANWDVFVEGFQFEDSWTNSTVYQSGDTVTYGGYVYVAKTNNTNAQPTTNPSDWEVFTTGFKFQGDWDTLDAYKVGDVVRLGGSTYVAIADNNAQEPPEATYWSLLNSGINWTTSTASYSQIGGTNASGQSGSGAKFDITRSKTVYTVTVSTGFSGSGYSENDVITISGESLGGTTPANDIIVTVTGVTAGAINTITHTGYSTSWVTARNYAVGDVVVYGASSFIATAKHTSETSNRPDNDLVAAYWNLLTLGSEALSLEKEGDLVYYGNNGPTRLPIGVDGQILRASDGFPDWANYGLIDNVIFVGPLGTDVPAPTSGLTIDKPFNSVSYALEQVKKGYLNPQTRDILKNNKQFLLKEITNWLKYTYSVTVTSSNAGTRRFTCGSTENLQDNMPIVFSGEVFGGVVAGTTYYIDSIINSTEFRISTTPGGVSVTLSTATGQMQGDLSYGEVKCERDSGLIIDALIYDVSRGGTLNTTNATKSYYTEAGNEYISSNLGNQRLQTIAANQQLKAIIAELLENKSPINYQSLNKIEMGKRAQQVIDFDLVAETKGKTKVAQLMDIVINGIEAESNTGIALPILPNTTVFIKTGTYNEVLPMILPEYTAVVGDELRTSVVQPAPAVELLSNDKDKRTSVLDRIKDVSSEIIQNVGITPTTGNTVSQAYVNGYGGNTIGTNRINNGVEIAQDVLRTGLSIVDKMPAVGPTPTSGSNNASDSGFANAVAQIEANYEFIKSEITAWVAVQVAGAIAPFASNFTYNADKWNDYIEYTLDALRYDTTYGGNFQSTVQARSFFVDGVADYASGEKEELLAAYAHLKSIVGDVITETPITPSSGNSLTQDLDGTAGSSAAETFAEARVQEIYDTIDTDGTLATSIASDTTWVANDLTTFNTAIVAKKSDIQNAVIDYVNSNFGEFEYDSGSCRRDSTILKTSSAYDTALGTNFNAVRDGLAYRRQMGINVIQNQLTQTLGTITAEKALVLALVSDATATTRNTAYWDEVLDIVENGTANADAITWSDPGVAAKTTARTEIQTNRAASITALTNWITATYPSHTYSQEICERDAGRVIDAVSYDIQYGGNSASYEAAKAYFEGYAETLPVSQRDISAAAFEQLSTIVQSTMTNATEKAEANTLITIVSKAIEAGTIIALPTKTYPDYSWAAAAIESDADDIIADTTVVPATLQYITNNYSTFEYNHTKCSRDIGFIVDGLTLDMMFGTTFNSLKSGMAYQRGITSTEYVLENQLEASLVSLDVVREEIKEITSGQQKVRDSATAIIDILANDTTPSSYTITDPVGYDTGFFNARRLVVANKQFLIDEAEAYMIDNYNAVWTALTADEKTQWKNEIGATVESLRYDLTYRGNLETIVTARKYYVDEVFSKPADEKASFLALHTRLAAIIDNIIIGDDSGWTKSSSNVSTQDVTGTAGSAGAGLFAVDRITEIKDSIDTGLVPASIIPSTTWVDDALVGLKTAIDARTQNIKDGAIAFINQVYPDLTYNETKCARDVGYIVDAITYDIIFNSDFRSLQAGLAYRRGITSTEFVIANQLNATVQTIEFIEEQLLELTMGQLAEEGTRDTSNRAYDLAIGIQTIAQNGLAASPGIELPTPPEWGTTGYANTAYASTANTTGDTNTFDNAVDQIVANKDFMVDEIENWVQDASNGFDTNWAALTADDQTRFITDIGYSIDAVRYDMIYGGNTQSLIVGSSYFTDFVSNITLSESAMTVGAYGRLKVIIGQVIEEATVTTSPGVTESQDTTGTAGNTNCTEFAQDRIDDVLDWLNNSGPNTTIDVATDYGTNDRKAAYAELVARKSEIVEDVVYWVEKYFQELIYNQDTCRRDTQLMVDAVTRDIITGSNYATVKAGMQYYRPTSSAREVLANQLKATVNSLGFLAEKVRRVACTNSSASIELLVDDLKAYINGGEVPAPKWIAPSNADANDVAGAAIIWENKKWIQAELTEYVNVNYPSLVYNTAEFKRDVGYVVDALRYDLTYNSEANTNNQAYQFYPGRQEDNLTITASEKAAYLDAFDYMKQIANGLVVNSVSSPGAIQDIEEPVLRDSLQVVGNAGTVARVEKLLTNFYNILNNVASGGEELTTTNIASNVFTTSTVHNLKLGDVVSFAGINDGTEYYIKTTPTTSTFTLSEYFNGPEADFTDGIEVYPTFPVRNADISTAPAALKQQFTNLSGSLAAIKTAMTSYIVSNYPTLVYDNTKFQNDVALLVDAVGRDMVSDSNYLTTFAAQAYFRDSTDDPVLGLQNNAIVQSYRELKNKIGTYINANKTALKRTNNLMDIVINMLDNGNGQTPEIHGTTTYLNSREMINAVDVMKANRSFLAEEAVAWLKASYGGTATEVTGSPGSITFSEAHNLSVGDPITFATAIGGVAANTTYWVSVVGSTTTIEISDKKDGEGLTFSGGTGSSVVTYAFTEADLRTDIIKYIEAIVYDLQYPGNHKVWKEAQKYLNSVYGSQRSDMFHVRNATGVRNMTVNGLRGNLTELNDFGTRRPTAGSYTSLDPGFGPWDKEAWVTNKSCYVQNVTTFGVGCVGCKIDGALHAGGNRSIVSNDFTQVLSDGIGVWCSGNNSLTELVSVFAYYNYSGYLADLGGRIRATNGNSSYGTFGVIAEGTDTGEIPITASVDNLSQDAIIKSVPTDGEVEVLRFEYANAGTGYTNAGVAISGAGFNAAVVQDEFRDQAVVEARLIDLNDNNGTGGEDYVSAQNVAQGGDEVSATLAATDTALSNAYVGMNLQLTAGTGVGQYGTVLTFNNGTKVAKVYKPNSGPYTITATNATGNKVTISGAIEQVYDDMPIYVASTVGGITAEALYYVINKNTDGSEVELSTSEGGSAITLTTTTGQTVAMYAAGWNHVLEGKTIETNLDLTTGYRVEPRVTFDEPGFTKTAIAEIDNVALGAIQFADVLDGGRFYALPASGSDTQANYSVDGTTWVTGGQMPTTGNWTKATFGGGQNARATAIVGGLGGTGAVLTAELGELNSIGLPGPTQIKKITVVDGGRGYVTAPTIVLTPTQGGGGASATATVKDGAIQEVIITSTGAGYSAAPTITAETDKVTEIKVDSFGRGYLAAPTITISGGGASTQATATATIDNGGLKTVTISLDGDDNPLRGSGYTSAPTVTITDTSAKYVAISEGTANNAYLAASSTATTNWTAGSPLPGTAYNDIAYGNGTYVVVGGDGSGGAGTSTDGAAWVSRTITTLAGGTDTFVGVAHGGNTFVAISAQDETAYSTNGISWTAGGALPSATGNWTAIEYGNSRYVALADSGEVAVSIDRGVSWTASPAGLKNIATTGWNNIAYGQGLFIITGGVYVVTSQYGLEWYERDNTAASGTDWYGVAFGNPSSVPTWVVANNATGATEGSGLKIDTGARTLGRTQDEDGSIISVTLSEPGSSYPVGTIVSTTSPNTIEVSSATNLYIGQPITIDGAVTSGIDSETLYYISAISGTDIEISLISGGASFDITTVASADMETTTFEAGPKVTIVDPNSTIDAAISPRIRNGALASPTFTNRGTGYTTATAELSGDGNADLYQPATFIAVRDLFELPEPGSNVEFSSIDGSYYKLVTISNVIGQPGSYTATFQVSPSLTVLNAPKDGTKITTTNKYSQVRLTGHDFLYIGTGNQAKTNYPFVDITTAYISSQQLSSGGGRVFFTSTDQDGNFNVGGLFGVQQSTGTATLDADAFNLAGLQSLQLGGIAVGIGSAVITQFSTDPFFTENSDNIVPTQRAIKSYITAQIGGGQSSLNVNTLTAGVIFIANDEITTTSGGQLNIKAKMNFTGGVDGAPVALGYFLSR